VRSVIIEAWAFAQINLSLSLAGSTSSKTTYMTPVEDGLSGQAKNRKLGK
jgi:hypothetical protein